MGRPTKPIVLSEDERAKLQEWARRPKTAQRLALRARIVLSCAEGMENRRVAQQLRITDQTVCKWRERFGLHDERVWPTNLGPVRRDRLQMLRWKL